MKATLKTGRELLKASLSQRTAPAMRAKFMTTCVMDRESLSAQMAQSMKVPLPSANLMAKAGSRRRKETYMRVILLVGTEKARVHLRWQTGRLSKAAGIRATLMVRLKRFSQTGRLLRANM